MPWRRDFPDYDVPIRIQDLVDRGLLEDVSAPDDPAPAFIARLVKRGWIRLWVEHPDFERRRAGPFRFRVEITDDLSDYGRVLLEDDVLNMVWPTLYTNVRILGVKSRFRLLGGGRVLPAEL